MRPDAVLFTLLLKYTLLPDKWELTIKFKKFIPSPKQPTIPLFGKQRMHRCSNGNIWTNHHIISNVDRTNIQTGKI